MPNPVDNANLDIVRRETFRFQFNLDTDLGITSSWTGKFQFKDEEFSDPVLFEGDTAGGEIVIDTTGAMPVIHMEISLADTTLFLFNTALWDLFITDDATSKRYPVAKGTVTIHDSLTSVV